MRFASLGSGSEGNALVVQFGASCVMMDCGFSLNETNARLARLGLTVNSLSGIVVTHEHGDHVAGVARLARKYSIPVWLTHGTRLAHGKDLVSLPDVTEIYPHTPFAVGELWVQHLFSAARCCGTSAICVQRWGEAAGRVDRYRLFNQAH